MPECRNNPCTCTSEEKWSCLTTQWNQLDRPQEEEEEKKIIKNFKEAIEKGDIKLAQKLLPDVEFKW